MWKRIQEKSQNKLRSYALFDNDKIIATGIIGLLSKNKTLYIDHFVSTTPSPEETFKELLEIVSYDWPESEQSINSWMWTKSPNVNLSSDKMTINGDGTILTNNVYNIKSAMMEWNDLTKN